MKVYLDDVRNPKREFSCVLGPPWRWVKTYAEAIKVLKTGKVTDISLDHDLGEEKSGYDVACWIEEAVVRGEIKCPRMYVHSMNPVGRNRIYQIIDRLSMYME